MASDAPTDPELRSVGSSSPLREHEIEPETRGPGTLTTSNWPAKGGSLVKRTESKTTSAAARHRAGTRLEELEGQSSAPPCGKAIRVARFLHPGPDRNFVGREDILRTLHDTLSRHTGESKRTVPHVVVLVGVTGIGKTEIARVYSHEICTKCSVYYIMCRNATSMIQSYRRELGAASSIGDELLVEMFAKRLREHHEPWLVVFDNVENPDDFNKFGPLKLQLGKALGSFLVTTRLSPDELPMPNASAKHKVVSVEPMKAGEARELVLKHLGPTDHEPPGLFAWIDRCGGHPLALSMVAAMLSCGDLSIQRFIEPFDRSKHSGAVSQQLLRRYPAAQPNTHDKISDFRKDELLTTEEAREARAQYFVIRITRHDNPGFGSDQEERKPTWESALHVEVPGITKEETERTVRKLNRTTISVAEKKENLSESQKRQVEFALEHLQNKFDNEWFRTALVELEDRTEKKPIKRGLRLGRSAQETDSVRVSVGPGAAHHKEYRGLSGVARASSKPHSSSNHPRVVTERVSITAYFKRSLRPGVNPTDVPGPAGAGSHGLKSDIADEDEEPQADDGEIESVLSNFLPSLTAGSTISSSLAPGLLDDIKSNVLTILTKDEDLCGLLKETPKRVTRDRFQRNFLRLFRSFLSDIRKQPNKRAQEIHQVIHVLRYQSRNIASHICREIFDLKSQSDALSLLALQVPDKNGQMISFLGDDSTILGPTSVDKEELPVDNNSSGGGSDEPETVQPYPIPLGDLENIILESTSFLTFRERYRAFLFPRSGLQSLEANTPKDIPVDVAGLRSEPLDLRMRSSLVEEGKESFLRKVCTYVLGRTEHLVRSPVKSGHIRIEWICDCGDDLYADFPESDGDSIRNLEMLPQRRHDIDGGSTACPGLPVVEEHQNSTSAPTPSPQLFGQENSASHTPGRNPSSQLGGQNLAATGTDTHASRRAVGRAGKRFIELCVNTGEFQRQLAEIDISDVKSDAQLFDRIRERYREVRSFRVNYFLLKPVDVHFVQFSVEDRHRVGILDKPMAIPSQAEMAAEGYGYHPCPLKPPPIPANIFLHHLSNPGPHKNLLWGNRIPQKLHRSILQIQAPDNLVIGWGVHVIEGLNKFAVLLCALAGLLVSGIVAAAWRLRETTFREDLV